MRPLATTVLLMHRLRVFAEKVPRRPGAAQLGRRQEAAVASLGAEATSVGKKGAKKNALKLLEITRVNVVVELCCDYIYKANNMDISCNRTRDTVSSGTLKTSTCWCSSVMKKTKTQLCASASALLWWIVIMQETLR